MAFHPSVFTPDHCSQRFPKRSERGRGQRLFPKGRAPHTPLSHSGLSIPASFSSFPLHMQKEATAKNP